MEQNVFLLMLMVFCGSVTCQSYVYYKTAYENSTLANVYSYDVVVDSQNFTYMVGSTDGSFFGTWNDGSGPSRTTDIIVAKYSSTLNIDTLNRVWGKQVQTSLTDAAYGVSLSVDESSLLVCGTFGSNPWIGRLSAADGSTLQSYQYPVSNVSNFYPRFQSVVEGPSSVVFAAGYYYTNGTTRWEGLIIKLNSSASLTLGWTKIVSKGTGSDDLMNAIAFLSSSSRLFVAGQVISPTYGKEFYLLEVNPANGATIFERIWPGTSCSGVGLGTGDIDNYISDIHVDTTGLYYVGASDQEIDSNGGTSTDVCGYGFAMVVGKLSLSNLSNHIWAYNISRTLDGFNVLGNSIDVGSDGIVYIGGNSDADTLLGQTGSNPFYMDWFLATSNASTGNLTYFTLQGVTVDDYLYGISARTNQGILGFCVSTALTKNMVTVYSSKNSPDPSPSPSITPTASRTPSVTPTATPTRSVTPTSSVTPSPSAAASITPSPSAAASITPTPSVTASVTPTPSLTPSVTPTSSVTPSITSSPSSSFTPIPAPQTKENNTIAIAVGVTAGAVAIAAVSVALFVFMRRKKQRTTDNHSEVPMNNMPGSSNYWSPMGTGASSGPSTENSNYAPIETETDYTPLGSARSSVNGMTEFLKINYKDLTVGAKLGQGAFGVVYKGKWRGGDVAIKQVHDNVTQEQVADFFKEAALMQKIRPHTNVVQFLGVCIAPLVIVTEFLERGSLYSFLRTEEGKNLTRSKEKELMKGIASGMYHLASEGIVHRDLAARNILLSASLVPKISDFGMSRLVVQESGSVTQSSVGPLKWMAPENVFDRKYSEKSDVWSYGILCIEIITKQDPYPDLDGVQVASRVGSKQTKPDIPEYSQEIQFMLKACFEWLPEDRPDFKTIFENLLQ